MDSVSFCFLLFFPFIAEVIGFQWDGGGVNVFLVITSFLLTSKFVDKPQQNVKILGVLWKRIKRLYPCYWALLFAITCLCILLQHTFPSSFFPYLLSAQNFYWLFHDFTLFDALAGHTWYITLDVYLFLIWLILLKIVPFKHLIFTFIVVIILTIIYRSVCVGYFDNVSGAYTLPFGQADSFALGALLAIYNKSKKKNNALLPMCFFIVGILGIVLCLFYTSYINDIGFIDSFLQYGHNIYTKSYITVNVFLFIAMVSFSVIWYCISDRFKHRLFSLPLVVKIGSWTYVLYIVHYPIILALQYITSNYYLIVLASLALTFFITIIWNKTCEKLVIKYIK